MFRWPRRWLAAPLGGSGEACQPPLPLSLSL